MSGLADKAAETLSLDSELRYNVINSSSNIATRIVNFFSLIENVSGRGRASNVGLDGEPGSGDA